jgi:Lrp/AsnC family transcriptional regulator, leucine-responsive regulatory protein
MAKNEIDAKDLAILKLLQQNARMTVKEIAPCVNLSVTPVHERIRKMEETGIIKKYVTVLDHKKVNKGLIVFCFVSLKEHGKEAGSSFIKSVIKFEEVVECYNIAGDFDLMLKVMVADMEQYHQFYSLRLCELKGINQVRSMFVMDVLKHSYKVV